MSYAKVRRQLERDMDKAHQERMARCIPVAKKAIAIIAQKVEELEMGDMSEVSDTYYPVAEAVLQMFLDENVYWQDRDFIFQLVMQPFSGMQRLIKASFDMTTDSLYTGAIGMDVRDLRAQDVDKLLRTGDKIMENRDMISEEKPATQENS